MSSVLRRGFGFLSSAKQRKSSNPWTLICQDEFSPNVDTPYRLSGTKAPPR